MTVDQAKQLKRGEFSGAKGAGEKRGVGRRREGWKDEMEAMKYEGRPELFVHHQVLRIREEDSHIGEDIREGLSAKEKMAFLHLSSHLDAIFYSRPILPSSPLGNKSAIQSVQ